MRRPFVALTLVGGSLVLPATAAAAPTWLAPAGLAGAGAGAPSAALGPLGDAVVAWPRGDRVEVRVRAPGGPYAEAAPLGDPGASLPQVAVAADGTALAAWAQGEAVAYSVRPAGGTFGPAQALGDAHGSGAVTALRLSVNDGGDAVLAYARGRAFAALRAAGGSFEAPAMLSAGGPCDLDAAIGEGGHVAVGWRPCSGARSVEVARRAPGAPFGEAETLRPGSAPVVTVDAAGAVVAAWEEAGTVRAASAAPEAAFGAPVRLSGDAITGPPAIAAAGGDVAVAWRIAGGRVLATRRTAGSFPEASAVSGEGVAPGAPVLAGGSDGSLVAGWLRETGEGAVAEAARAPARGGFAAAAAFSGPGASALDLALDSHGNALAGHLEGAALVARTLDAAGPVLHVVDVRPAGFAQQSYPFAVGAADAWSEVVATAFDFGDGTSAPGPVAEHAYAGAGEHAVTVTAADSVGNATSASRTFLAAPALDRTPPVLRAVKLDARRFRVSGSATPVAAAVRAGTRFRYTLSEPAQATIFFERRRKRRWRPVGLITRRHPVAGKVSVGFSGRIVGRNGPLTVVGVRLRPGRHRATIVAADEARNVSRPKRRKFRVVP